MIAESLAVLDDMKACRAEADIAAYNLALQAAVRAGNGVRINEILWRMVTTGTHAPHATSLDDIIPADLAAAWTHQTYTHLLYHCARTLNFEWMVILLQLAATNNVQLDDHALTHVLSCASDAHEPRFAFEFLQAEDTRRGAHAEHWMRVLRMCATQDYAPGLAFAWQRSVDEGQLVPDDGLLAYILWMASRAGDHHLVRQVLSRVQDPDDMHWTAALDAACEAELFDNAMSVLIAMKHGGVNLREPALAHLTASVAATPSTLQRGIAALFAVAPSAPTEAWMAVLYAAVDRSDVESAKQLVTKMPRPGAPAFAAWISCCLQAQDWEGAQQAWAALQSSGVDPSSVCYERMIRLCLLQPQYEEAFDLLEEAKSRNVLPTRRTYAAMIWTCSKHHDERWRDLLQEMQEANYEPGDQLRSLAEANPMPAMPAE